MVIIGIGGAARNGQDTFFTYLNKYLSSNGVKSARRSFGDFLKAEIYPLITSSFGFSSFTTDPKEKDMIRPIMVAYGCAMREKTKGTYWVKKLHESAQSLRKEIDVLVVTDVRFNDHAEDEVAWIKSNNGKLIFIERYLNGKVIPSPNDIEQKNNTLVKKDSDFVIKWGEGYPSPEDIVKEFADKHIIPLFKNGDNS